MITLFQIDKSGGDVFEKDYSIAMIMNKKEVYGINVPQNIKDEIMHLFRKQTFWKQGKDEKASKLRLRIRLHTSLIILLIQQAIKDQGYAEELSIEICNDYDGHFHEVKDMIFKNISKIVPLLKPEDIVQTKFQKPSLVDTAAKNLRGKDKIAKTYNILKINVEELISLIKR